MAKISIKSEKITPFGGIFHVREHSLVQFLLHSVKEIGAAFVLPAFDVYIEAVAVL